MNNSDEGGSLKGSTYTVADWLVGVASFSNLQARNSLPWQKHSRMRSYVERAASVVAVELIRKLWKTTRQVKHLKIVCLFFYVSF